LVINNRMVTKQAKTTVLLIEDDPDQVLLYQTKFRLEGFTALTAKSGAEGIKTAIEKRPDVILLDILMDDMDGLTVLRHLKQDKRTKAIPVFLFTNLAKQEVAEQGLALGAVAVLVKMDYTPGMVVEKVRAVVGK